MLRLPDFTYIRPRTLAEASRVLGDLGPEAMAVAGGTDVYPKMKRGQFTPRYVVSLSRIEEHRGIRREQKRGLWIGAGETLSAVAGHEMVRGAFPALAAAAGLVSTLQLRNAGTIGGNLFVDTRCNYYDQSFFWRQAVGFCLKKDGDICLVAPGSRVCLAICSSDTAPVLSSLDAEAVLVSAEGTRRVPLDALYRDDGMYYLTKRPDELLQGVWIPEESFGWRNVYLKLRRRGSFDFPVLGVAAALRVAASGACEGAKIVLTAVASAPKVVADAPGVLCGKPVETGVIEEAAELAMRVSHPLDNADMDYWYRKRMTRVYVTRALQQLAAAGETAGGPHTPAA
jgi:4-hydroxybenzoyl-CoA reductase subunit beta